MLVRRSGWASLAVLAVLAASCGSSSASHPGSAAGTTRPSSATPVATAAGAPFQALTFTTLVPHGWRNQTAQLQAVEGRHFQAAFLYHGRAASILVGEGVANKSPRTVLNVVAHERGRFDVSAIRPITLAGQHGLYVQFSERQNGTVEREQEATFNRTVFAYELIFAAPVHQFRSLTPALDAVERAWRWLQ